MSLEEWEAIAKASETTKIDAIIINSHGSPYRLTDNNWSIKSSDISKLDHCDVGWLLLSGCNAGHVDHAGSNPANAFAGIITGRVYASDGTVYVRYDKKRGRYLYSSESGGFFPNYTTRESKTPIGWVYYYGGEGQFTVLSNTNLVVWNGVS